MKVGSINETTEAKATNLGLDISSIALGASYSSASSDGITLVKDNSSFTVTLELQGSNVDSWLDRGFSEGDKITIVSTANATWNISVTIDSFSVNDKKITGTIVGKDTAIPSSDITNETSAGAVTVNLSTDEVAAILNDPNDTTYAGYINREVSIYKVHINPNTGAIIGDAGNNKKGPYLIFKGIIGKVKLSEDPAKGSKVTWTLTSHWGDFVRVNGRITSDSEHLSLIHI